jgi:hypothetical protein
LFDGDADAFNKVIETLGETPLPNISSEKLNRKIKTVSDDLRKK